MDFIQIIGFIISLLALLYLFMKQETLNRYRANSEELKEGESSEKDSLEEFMQLIDQKKEKKRKTSSTPKPSARPVPTYPQSSSSKRSLSLLEDYHLASEIEKRQIISPLERRSTVSSSLHHRDHEISIEPSRACKILQRLADRRDLLVYQEIIDKPKSLRPPL